MGGTADFGMAEESEVLLKRGGSPARESDGRSQLGA